MGEIYKAGKREAYHHIRSAIRRARDDTREDQP